MFLTGLGTANPLSCYTQQDCWAALIASDRFSQLSSRAQAILKKVLRGQNGIETRSLALDQLCEAFDLAPDALHARFRRHAPQLASDAARAALAEAQLSASDIDAVLISTCTGYLCPGLTSYVAEALGLPAEIIGLDLVGQGCAAAPPNWLTAQALLGSGRCRRVLSICVEVCSAAFYLDDDPGVLISACLFGDGAGAAVLESCPRPGQAFSLEFASFGSTLSVVDRDYLRFEQRGGMLRNILAPQVPALAAKHAETVLSQVLSRTGITREQITGWILHPGGREILVSLRQRLGLTESDVWHSAEVLRRYGNLSSASLYFVLRSALDHEARPGFWWLSSFGAGFTCHGTMVRVRGSAQNDDAVPRA